MSGQVSFGQLCSRTIADHLTMIAQLGSQQLTLERIAVSMARAMVRGNKILWCGNGGSAADSQHLASEFVGRFRRERRGMASIALTTDTSILTAIANDYGYDEVFRRQVEALCVAGDVVVGISTSGNSRSVVLALAEARMLGAHTVGFSGGDGGALAEVADELLLLAHHQPARIQEGHILCGHLLCDWVEQAWCAHAREMVGAEAPAR